MDMRLYADALRPVFVEHVPEEIVWELACELATIAASWPAGTILERNLDRFKQRLARSAQPSRRGRPGSRP